MGSINKTNLINILKPFKDILDTKISAFNTRIFECDIDKYTKMVDIPYEFKYGTGVAIDNNIYLLGSGYKISNDDETYTLPYVKYNYKYDITTNTYTQNTDIPYNFYNGSAVAIDNNIYLLGSGYRIPNGNETYTFPCAKYNYKYDTTTNTYTQNTDIPYPFTSASAVAIGNDIYLLGSSLFYYDSSNNPIYKYATYNYKYDTTTNTYTKLTDIPYNFYNGTAVAVGTNIYLLGSSHYYYDDSNVLVHPCAKYNYKYDITTNAYSKLTDIPYELYAGIATVIGTDIYVLGSSCYDYDNSRYLYAKCNYKYNTTTNTYTQNTDIPYSFSDGSGVAIGTDIYVLGGLNSNKYNYKYRIPITTNCIIKPKNHSIYTSSNKSYTNIDASLVEIGDEYYTEYNGNNIINNTAPISSKCTTKMYIKQGAILNGKSITVDTEGWQDINLLNYM